MVGGDRHADKTQFKYHVDWVENDGKKQPIHRPRIEIVFRKNAERYDSKTNPEFRTHGLVDSGADICCIPRQIADILQLELKDETKKETIGANGKFWTYRATMHLEIVVDKGIRVPIGMVEVAVPEKDPEGIDLEKNILLGRKGLFTTYEITFNEVSQTVRFVKIPTNKPHR